VRYDVYICVVRRLRVKKAKREVLRNSIMKVGGNWPITKCDLANKDTKVFKIS
jgi:hypothetical protein